MTDERTARWGLSRGPWRRQTGLVADEDEHGVILTNAAGDSLVLSADDVAELINLANPLWLALLDTPPPASPRQGEPVDGLDEAWKAAEAALPDGWDGPRMLPIGTRGSVSRWIASAIAHSAAARDNRAWIVDGSGPTPAEALQALRAALSEPAEL